ncbi:MAG: Rpn family recombination-promoting nuclease/putative transposase [Lachnospiraceae bacterium]|nr:Rpn family recombination-promoting nuclease/putative transposase [Lachnospiraceae bacterium]
MAQKDISEKYLEEYPDVFADIVNVLVLGKNYINPDNLYNGPTESIYKSECGAGIREHRRDVSKYYIRNKKVIALFGIENQSTIDKDMAIRIMGYDYSSYRSQIDIGKNRYPVITVLLNFTDKKWNVPTSLEDIFEYSAEWSEYIPDYRIKVIDVAYLSKDTRNKLNSDFKIVADFFAERRSNKKYRPSDEEIKHEMAVLNMIRVFTRDKRYDEIKAAIKLKRKEERWYLCVHLLMKWRIEASKRVFGRAFVKSY